MAKTVRFPVVLETEVADDETVRDIPEVLDYINAEIAQRFPSQKVVLSEYTVYTPETTSGFED